MIWQDSGLCCVHCHTVWECEWDYCPECQRNYGGAVYPERQTPSEVREVELLCQAIREAFANVRRGDGLTLHEADLEGCATERTLEEARRQDPEQDWRDVPDWKLAKFYAALSFLDVAGWRFYLPAYMTWTLRHWRTSDSPTVDSLIWGLGPGFEELTRPRFASLSPTQATVVWSFLDFFVRYAADRDSRQAIAAYWHLFRPDGPPDEAARGG